MLGEIDKAMMLKFLKNNYPVIKVKVNGKFNRAITVDLGMSFLLNNKMQVMILQQQLFIKLKYIFNFDDDVFCLTVLNYYLNLK